MCLGILMIKILRGGEGGGNIVQEWVNVRVGIYKNRVRGKNDVMV